MQKVRGISFSQQELYKKDVIRDQGEIGGKQPLFLLTAPKVLDITENTFYQF